MPSIILSDNGVSSGSAGLKSVAASDGALALQTTTAGGSATTAVSIDTSQNVTFTNAANLPNTFGFKNRIINGGMMIDQRNAGASVTGSTSDPYTTDRWKTPATQNSKFTFQQNAGSVTPPVGYINYLGATSSSAYSVLSSDYFTIQQNIEGLNLADLGWGAVGAATVTLSFWVRSSLTGTFGGSFVNSAQNRSYPFTYTISSANTWEQKTITVAGDTSGTWLTTNGIGLRVSFSLGSGSTYTGAAGSWAGALYYGATGQTNIVSTSGATFYITGVQLEKGSTATSFDYRPYGTELALCQRYYQLISGILGSCSSSSLISTSINMPVEMRASPSVGVTGAMAFSDFSTADYTQSSSNVSINSGTRVNARSVFLNFSNFTGLTTNRPVGNIMTTNSLTLSAEL